MNGTFLIQKVVGSKPFSSQHGELYDIHLAGLLDGDLQTNCHINAKTPDKYQEGQSIQVDWRPDNYGIKMKLLPPSTVATVPAKPVGQTSVPVAEAQFVKEPSSPWKPEDSGRQNSIERQSSLAQAVERCAALANIYASQKKWKEAEETLSGKHILQVATYLNKYVKGDVTVVMTPEDVAYALGYEPPRSEEEQEDYERYMEEA